MSVTLPAPIAVVNDPAELEMSPDNAGIVAVGKTDNSSGTPLPAVVLPSSRAVAMLAIWASVTEPLASVMFAVPLKLVPFIVLPVSRAVAVPALPVIVVGALQLHTDPSQ